MARQELIDWLNSQLYDRRLTGAEASKAAGLNIGAISEIINGRTPGLAVCKALANFFGVSPEYVLRLARHLPPLRPAPGGADADPVRAELIRQISDGLYKLPAERGRRIAEAFLVLVQAEKVADHATKTDVLPEPAERE